MPIKALFNEGAVDKGKLEAFADACLSVIARPLWYGKSVKIIEKDNKLIAEHDPNSKSFTESINPPGNIGFLLVGIGYLVASVLAFIPLTIGLGLKKIALVNDPKARLYNQMASHCLQKEKVEERLKQVQREKVEVDKTIAAAAKTILTLDNIKEGDETPQITGLKKSCNWTIEKIHFDSTKRNQRNYRTRAKHLSNRSRVSKNHARIYEPISKYVHILVDYKVRNFLPSCLSCPSCYFS